MDPGFGLSPTELYELLAVAGGVLGTGVLGFLVVRRARATRRRQIDEAGEARPPRELSRRRTSARELEESPEPEALPSEPQARQVAAPEPATPPPEPATPPPAPRARTAPSAAPAPARPAAAPAQVLPFPARHSSPASPASPALPVDKPLAPVLARK